MRWMSALCQAWSPWHMLRRATFMPAVASSPSVLASEEAGPMVQMILVRRVERKPGERGEEERTRVGGWVERARRFRHLRPAFILLSGTSWCPAFPDCEPFA